MLINSFGNLSDVGGLLMKYPRVPFPRRYRAGFTLLEMVLSIVILGILAGTLAPMFANTLTAAATSSSAFDALSSVSLAMQRMSREIRQIDIVSAANLRCVKNDSAQTQFNLSYSGNTLSLAYATPAASAALLQQVSAFQLRYLDANGTATVDMTKLSQVEISLTVSVNAGTNSSDMSLRTRVSLRDRA